MSDRRADFKVALVIGALIVGALVIAWFASQSERPARRALIPAPAVREHWLKDYEREKGMTGKQILERHDAKLKIWELERELEAQRVSD